MSHIPVHTRLGITEPEYATMLREYYWTNELSQQQIADKIGVYVGTIEKHFLKHNIELRSMSDRDIWQKKNCEITKKQLEAMDGILLADGHLDPSPVAARLTYGCKFKSTLSDIEKQFDQFHFSEPWLSKTGYWHHKSSYYRDLLCHRKRWYDGKTKIIPEDVMITPLSCYWWFVGDGYQVNYGLKFCTEAFDRQSMDIVRSKLEDLGFSTSITPSSNRLRIRGKSAPRMLDWIRSNINIAEQYTYKWGNHRKQSI